MYQNDSKKINKRNLITGLFLTGLILLGSHAYQLAFLPSQINYVLSPKYVQLILFLPVLIWVPENLWLGNYLDLKRRQLPRDFLFIVAILIGLIVSLIFIIRPELTSEFGWEIKTYFGSLASLLIIKEITDFGMSYWLKKVDYDRNLSFYEKNLFAKIQRFSWFGLGLALLITVGWAYLSQAPFYLIISLLIAALVVISPKYLLLAASGLLSRVIKTLDQKKVKLTNPDNLINLAQLGRIIFYKTGVLTTGQLKVTDIVAAKPKDLMKLAGSLEQGITDPIALALAEKVDLDKLTLSEITQQKIWPGLGVTGQLNGRRVALGNMALMKQENIVVGVLQREKSRLEKMGKKVLVLGFAALDKSVQAKPGEVVGLIALKDEVRTQSKALIEYLSSQGVESWIITGESQVSAEIFGQSLGLNADNILSEILPSQRDLIINELKKRNQPGKALALVHLATDKINYKNILNIALNQSDNFSQVIPESDVVISANQLGKIEDLIRDSLTTNQRLNFNLNVSLIYAAIFIPISLGVFLFAPLNLALNPVLAVALSSLLGAGLVANSNLSNKN